MNQGILAQRAKKNSEAEDAFKQALEIQPNNVNALNSLGTLLFLYSYIKIFQSFSRFL